MQKLASRTSPSLTGGKGYSAVAVKFRNFGEEAAFLRKMVNHFSGDLAIKELALQIVRDAGVPQKDEYGQAMAIGQWWQDNIYYVHEARETFQNPHITLKMRAGDCDKYAVGICSMLGTLGIREKLCILKINGRWAHIFAVAVVVRDHEAHRLTLDGTLDKAKYPVSELPNPIAIVRARGDVCEPLFA